MKTWTMQDIQTANRVRGFHWFDPGTMRCFGTRVYPEVYQGKGGVYFVTSDKAGPRPESGREFNVREFFPVTGQTGTATRKDDYGETVYPRFKTKIAAVRKARALAVASLEVSAAPFRPLTDADHLP